VRCDVELGRMDRRTSGTPTLFWWIALILLNFGLTGARGGSLCELRAFSSCRHYMTECDEREALEKHARMFHSVPFRRITKKGTGLSVHAHLLEREREKLCHNIGRIVQSMSNTTMMTHVWYLCFKRAKAPMVLSGPTGGTQELHPCSELSTHCLESQRRLQKRAATSQRPLAMLQALEEV